MKAKFLPAASLLLGTVLAAQVPDPAAGSGEVTQEAADAGGQPGVDADRNNLLRYMGVVWSTKPIRLAPGESGTLLLVLSLHENAVLMAGEKILMTYASPQSGLELGAWTIRPPVAASLYQNLSGKLVYEKYAILELPITVARETRFGKHSVDLTLEAQVHDGRTGDALALAKADVKAEILVGPPVPRPVPITVPEGDVVEAPAVAATEDPAQARPPETERAAPALGQPRARVGEGRSEPAAQDGQAAGGPAEAAGSDNFVLYGLLGFVALGIVAVLAHQIGRKR